LLAAELAVPSALGDAAELLDVEVDQFARSGHLVAADRVAGNPIDMPRRLIRPAGQDAVHR
jgi:hypothetical protein